MEMYDVSDFGNTDTYMMPGVESNIHLTSPLIEQSEAMYNEGVPELVAGHAMYYPTAANFGYYCTGYESPGEWEDHHRVFGIDGPDAQYTGAQNEFLSYVYYTPNYGYAQSHYNPYNPYIPGAMMGVDGPFVGAQPYYPISYQNSLSAPAYVPIAVQQDIVPSNSSENSKNVPAIKSNERVPKAVSSGIFPNNPSRHGSNQVNSLYKPLPEAQRTNVGSSNQSVKRGGISAGSFQGPVSSHIRQGNNYSGSSRLVDDISNGKFASLHNKVKASIPFNNGVPDFGQNADGRGAVSKLRPKIVLVNNDINVSDTMSEENRGPRVNRSRNELAVRAFSTKASDCKEDGTIIICSDQYNKNDFPIDYVDAKFFVIKSYSEDDVHKSIKYNVWSSTPHGNKKLNSAYEEALRIANGKPNACPIFLFYSVNASGQFCGVAEITGPVDFNKDMDFWQQDKWSGSFPVKWHIIKDVSNANFRHIILENNENKPVTNSRDTQEISFWKGLEMLKIFKNHSSKTSLLDDFVYYENRQKLMLDEKARLCIRSMHGPFFPTVIDPPRKPNSVAELSRTESKKLNELTVDLSQVKIGSVPSSELINSTKENGKLVVKETKGDAVSTSNVGTMSSGQVKVESRSSTASVPLYKNTDVVTVGSMPIKVNGYSQTSPILTVGTIPLDPEALQLYSKDTNVKI